MLSCWTEFFGLHKQAACIDFPFKAASKSKRLLKEPREGTVTLCINRERRRARAVKLMKKNSNIVYQQKGRQKSETGRTKAQCVNRDGDRESVVYRLRQGSTTFWMSHYNVVFFLNNRHECQLIFIMSMHPFIFIYCCCSFPHVDSVYKKRSKLSVHTLSLCKQMKITCTPKTMNSILQI